LSVVRRFAAFWYDFIVGDSWELAVGVMVVLAAAKLFDSAAPAIADQVLFLAVPLGVVAVLATSLARAER
jgi:hypothetical protein